MTEHDIQDAIRIALSKYGLCFRTNAGEFWQGKKIFSAAHRQDVLTDIRRVAGLPKGFSDLVFFGEDGRAGFIEVKAPGGRVRPEQVKFLTIMQEMGYPAGVAHSVDEAKEILGYD